jgi:hypothetical protein
MRSVQHLEQARPLHRVLQPGTSTFELYLDDKKLAEKTFQIYRE